MEFLRRRIGLILQVLVSVLIIAWLTRIVDWREVWSHMRTMDPRWLGLGLISFAPVLIIVSWRWRMLLAVHEVRLRLWRIFELTMIGQFFGTVGLGTTGGDVAKVFYAARAVPSRRAAVAFTIIVDRVIGLIALLIFGVVLSFSQLSLLFSQNSTRVATGTFYLFAVAGIVGAGVVSLSPALVKIGPIKAIVDKLLKKRKRGLSLYHAYMGSARAVGTNIIALIVSLPSHVCSTLMGYCVIRAMHLTPVPDMLTTFSIIAIVNMLVALPVSVSGVGVRESLFIMFLGLLHIDKDHATAFSITCFAMSLVWCLAGGPFYYLYRHETHTPPPSADEVDPIFEQ